MVSWPVGVVGWWYQSFGWCWGWYKRWWLWWPTSIDAVAVCDDGELVFKAGDGAEDDELGVVDGCGGRSWFDCWWGWWCRWCELSAACGCVKWCGWWYDDEMWVWPVTESLKRADDVNGDLLLLFVAFSLLLLLLYFKSCWRRDGGVWCPPVPMLEVVDSSPSLSYWWTGDFSSAKLPWTWRNKEKEIRCEQWKIENVWELIDCWNRFVWSRLARSARKRENYWLVRKIAPDFVETVECGATWQHFTFHFDS